MNFGKSFGRLWINAITCAFAFLPICSISSGAQTLADVQKFAAWSQEANKAYSLGTRISTTVADIEMVVDDCKEGVINTDDCEIRITAGLADARRQVEKYKESVANLPDLPTDYQDLITVGRDYQDFLRSVTPYLNQYISDVVDMYDAALAEDTDMYNELSASSISKTIFFIEGENKHINAILATFQTEHPNLEMFRSMRSINKAMIELFRMGERSFSNQEENPIDTRFRMTTHLEEASGYVDKIEEMNPTFWKKMTDRPQLSDNLRTLFSEFEKSFTKSIKIEREMISAVKGIATALEDTTVSNFSEMIENGAALVDRIGDARVDEQMFRAKLADELLQ